MFNTQLQINPKLKDLLFQRAAAFLVSPTPLPILTSFSLGGLLFSTVKYFHFTPWSFFFDAAKDLQIFFQLPATVFMKNLIDLHNDLMSNMIIIAFIVFFLIGMIFIKFRAGNAKERRNFYFTHHTSLKGILTYYFYTVLYY